MLITQLKSRETIASLVDGKKVFIINCHGCKEVHFPEKEAEKLQKELAADGNVTGDSHYGLHMQSGKYGAAPCRAHRSEIEAADVVLVLSCGVGVQTVAGVSGGEKGVRSLRYLPAAGIPGVTPLEYDCDQCGECYLNLTGGICPITACSKSLVNGQCGGAKNGKCEVDGEMECGWERIYRRLAQMGRLDVLKCPTQVRNFATDEEVSNRETVM